MLVAPKREEYQYQQFNSGSASVAQHKSLVVPKIVLVTMVLAAFLSGLFMTSKHVQVTVLGSEINQIKKQINALKKENERLQLDIARLSAPERVATIASTKLGMQEPDVRQFKLVTPLPEQQLASAKLAQQRAPTSKTEITADETGFVDIMADMVSGWVGGISQVEASQL